MSSGYSDSKFIIHFSPTSNLWFGTKLVCFCLCDRINNVGPRYFTVPPIWHKSYHNTGPRGTFMSHLVHHRTLSKTLTSTFQTKAIHLDAYFVKPVFGLCDFIAQTSIAKKTGLKG